MESDGLTEVVFWRDTMNTVEDFLRFCDGPGNLIVFVFKEGRCCGFAWLTGISESYAFGHFCFFSNAWGDSETPGNLVIDYWFSFPGESGPLLDTILGMVPDFNERAHRFVENIKFKRLGTVPNMLKSKDRRAGAVVFYRSRLENG